MRQASRCHGEWQRDPDVFLWAKRLAPQFRSRFEHLPQQFAGMLAETLALRRQLGRIDAAVDEIETEPGLQRLDAPAERGLRGVSPLRGAREIGGFGNHQEILQPTQLHYAPCLAS